MFIKDVESLQKFATEFAATLRAPCAVALYGGLGVGKTEFARAVIRALGGQNIVVPSPTFTIVQNYGNISHFDLYRVKSAAELEEIGFFDAISTDITLIEWPEIAEPFLPKNVIKIRLDINGGGRELTLGQ